MLTPNVQKQTLDPEKKTGSVYVTDLNRKNKRESGKKNVRHTSKGGTDGYRQ